MRRPADEIDATLGERPIGPVHRKYQFDRYVEPHTREQAKLGGGNFEVVAVNIDTRDPDKPRNWLKEVGITRLAYYADPSAKVFQDLKLVGRAFGMPTTLIVDPAGCEIGTVAGPAEWASEDAVKLMSTALGRSS